MHEISFNEAAEFAEGTLNVPYIEVSSFTDASSVSVYLILLISLKICQKDQNTIQSFQISEVFSVY
jgi:hypothetical protein